jgi:hypothetical protein
VSASTAGEYAGGRAYDVKQSIRRGTDLGFEPNLGEGGYYQQHTTAAAQRGVQVPYQTVEAHLTTRAQQEAYETQRRTSMGATAAAACVAAETAARKNAIAFARVIGPVQRQVTSTSRHHNYKGEALRLAKPTHDAAEDGVADIFGFLRGGGRALNAARRTPRLQLPTTIRGDSRLEVNDVVLFMPATEQRHTDGCWLGVVATELAYDQDTPPTTCFKLHWLLQSTINPLIFTRETGRRAQRMALGKCLEDEAGRIEVLWVPSRAPTAQDGTEPGTPLVWELEPSRWQRCRDLVTMAEIREEAAAAEAAEAAEAAAEAAAALAAASDSSGSDSESEPLGATRTRRPTAAGAQYMASLTGSKPRATRARLDRTLAPSRPAPRREGDCSSDGDDSGGDTYVDDTLRRLARFEVERLARAADAIR